MTVPLRDLGMYLDLVEEGGRAVVGVVIEDRRGEEVASRRKTLTARDSRPPESLLMQFFGLLEDAVIHDGTHLRIHLCPRYRGIDLGLPVLPPVLLPGLGKPAPAIGATAPADPASEAACEALRERIRELATAFERVTISVLEVGHENRATPVLQSGAGR